MAVWVEVGGGVSVRVAVGDGGMAVAVGVAVSVGIAVGGRAAVAVGATGVEDGARGGTGDGVKEATAAGGVSGACEAAAVTLGGGAALSEGSTEAVGDGVGRRVGRAGMRPSSAARVSTERIRSRARCVSATVLNRSRRSGSSDDARNSPTRRSSSMNCRSVRSRAAAWPAESWATARRARQARWRPASLTLMKAATSKVAAAGANLPLRYWRRPLWIRSSTSSAKAAGVARTATASASHAAAAARPATARPPVGNARSSARVTTRRFYPPGRAGGGVFRRFLRPSAPRPCASRARARTAARRPRPTA